MKRFKIIIWVMVAMPVFLTAQPYLSNYNEWTNKWEYLISSPPLYYQYTHYYVNGDSLISNGPYKKIFRSLKNCGNLPWQPPYPGCTVPPSPPTLAALIREIGSRWYILTPGGQDSLLYRFDLVKGDSVVIGVAPFYDYVKIDTVILNYNNSGRKLFHVKDSTEPPGTPITYRGYLEGVGPSTGFLSTPMFFPFEQSEELICYKTLASEAPCIWFTYVSLNEANIITSPLLLYPNPAHNTLTLKLPNNTGFHLCVTDVLGSAVLDQDLSSNQNIDVSFLPKGLYFAEIHTGIFSSKCKFIKED